MRAIGVSLATALLVSGCAAPERELSTEISEYVALPSGRLPADPSQLHPELQGFRGGLAKLERVHGRALKILQISGGGQNGAFGAGVLYGWGETGKRPRFDIVTGISVGALLATHAALGTREDDETLKEIFTNISKSDVYTEGGVLRLVAGGDSLMDTAPLRRLIDKHLSDEIIDRVAAISDEHRKLLVGTVNLDMHQLWMWDMTQIAKDGERELYREVLLAAASPPLMFPPVEIDGFLLADGATADNLLVIGQVGPSTSFSRSEAARGRFYVIHNGRSNLDFEAIPRDAKHIVSNSLGVMMEAQMAQTLIRAYAVATVHGYPFRLARIPDDVPVDADVMAFDTEEMRALFVAGQELGRNPERWLHKPPPTQQIRSWLIDATGQIPMQRQP